MPDIATIWRPGEAGGDWVLVGPDLQGGSDLETAVLISLFTDRVADPEDPIPDGSGDPRGWWGDLDRTAPLGSKLWLLERAKRTEETRLLAIDYAEEALAWMVDASIAESVSATAAWAGRSRLDLGVVILEPGGRETTFNYQWAWEALN